MDSSGSPPLVQSQSIPIGSSASAGSASSSSWAQAAGKSLQATPPNTTSVPMNQILAPPSAILPPQAPPPPASAASKQAMELLSNMREALFAQDGWGGQNVNQDSGWDVPNSPEPNNPMNKNSNDHPNGSGGLNWKANNRTELWDANIRGIETTSSF